ncbi:MAG: hypothetical protein M0R46_11650 [Candidatus Muirbacterium halophilum]|nr:hypothetical protein [Candidatus Muirbacterium halophilum]
MQIRNYLIKTDNPRKVMDYLKSINEPIYKNWYKYISILNDLQDSNQILIGYLDDEDQEWDWDGDSYWYKTYPNRIVISFNELLREEKLKRILK